MDLQQIRYFRAIAQCGSLTSAAHQLRISQPTLTVALRNLEESLATTLFLRNRSGVTLTPAGEELLSHAEQILRHVQVAEERVRGIEEDLRGTFVVGCHESLGAYFLPGFLRAFLEQAPEITVTLWNGTSQQVYDAVLERKVHFGLVVNGLPHNDLVLVPLFHDAVELLAAAARIGKEPLSLDQAHALLKEGPIIFPGRVGQCRELLGRLAAVDLLAVRRVECGDLELAKSLALAGLGIALIPWRVATYGHEGKLMRLHPDLPTIPDTIHLVYRGDFHRTRAARCLKDALVAFGRSLDEA